jgi:hypothetical protein
VENIINRKNIRVRGRVEFIGTTVSGINSESGFQKLSAIRDIKVIYKLFYFQLRLFYKQIRRTLILQMTKRSSLP